MVTKDIKYVVVTPVRDEEAYLSFTIESMAAQTIRPAEWVIVNDGSTDRTAEIIETATRKYPWIRAVHREDRGYRKWGAGIIDAFYAGYNQLVFQDWEFLSKLDGDLSFEPTYFEQALNKFLEDPKLGIGGGVLYGIDRGIKVLERHPLFHVRGGTKIYRKACWKALDGLWVGPGSDTLDDVKANMLGFTTLSFIDLPMMHHRWTGEAYGRWGGIIKNGKTDYVSGYHPLFLIAKSVYRLAEKPYVLGSLALLYGYLSAYREGMPQVDDPQLIKYLQHQQLAKLFGRKTIWK
jgi:biofilm PGA synthesis N-glycosyltransferase PgaC